MKISNLKLSNKDRAIIVAEIGINHEGNFQKCLKMILKAKNSGADLIKLQIADPQTDYSRNSKSYQVFQSVTFSKEEIFKIYKFAKKNKIKLFSTFGRKNFDFFKKLDQCCYKISSSLFNDFFFIKDILKIGKPVILSTGVSELKDIDLFLNLIRKEKNKKLAILHCRSLYPAHLSKLNLSRISYLKSKYGIITGFSDHSIGIDAAVASIHHGAKIIEKHFTLDEKKKGFDHRISLSPKNFEKMVKSIRINENMIGTPGYRIDENSSDFRQIKKISRNFVTLRKLKKRVKLSKNDFSLMRTSSKTNYSKFHKIFPKILNKKIIKNLKTGSILKINDFEK